MKRRFLLPVFLLPLSIAAAELVNLDFTKVFGGAAEVRSSDGLLSYKLEDSVKISGEGPGGKPALVFNGKQTGAAKFDALALKRKFAGDEMGASFWFRDDAGNGGACFGLTVGKPDADGNGSVSISIPTKKTDFDPYRLVAHIQDTIPTGMWHHVAFTYSQSNTHFKVWFNGKRQRDHILNVDQPAPIADFFGLAVAPKGFCGAISEIKVWNRIPEDGEILSAAISKSAMDAAAKEFEAAAAKDVPPAFKKWCLGESARIKGNGSVWHIGEWMRIETARRNLGRLSAFAREIQKSAGAATLKDAPFLPLSIYPYSHIKRLPYVIPHDGKPAGKLEKDIAKGEYESLSFMVYPYRDVDKFHMTVSDLKTTDGETIAASQVDVKVVKVWYIASACWDSYFGGGRDYPALAPELLLHDDALIKTIEGGHKNFLRLSYPTGERYVDISKRGSPENIPQVDIFKEPVLDAKCFVPLNLKQGALRQFWITVHVPPKTKEGHYTGKLAFTENGNPLGSMDFSVNVLPFSLPKAATRYNIDKRFYGTWTENTISLERKLRYYVHDNYRPMTSLSNACARALAEYKNMAAHNMLNPWTAALVNEDELDLQEMQLSLMEQAGLEMKPLFGSLANCSIEWCSGIPRQAKDYPNRDVSIFALSNTFLRCMSDYSNLVSRTMERLEKRLGHRDIFCHGIDEAGPGTIRRSMPFFSTLRYYGGKPWINMCHAKWVSFSVDANCTPASINRGNAQLWHEGGAETATYAAPFSGPSNPVLWRRSKGIRLYMANYDGVNEYCYCTGTDIWNEFSSRDRYGVFSIVFPSQDGVIDTVPWEALREGFDDVRYLTLLRRLSREAIRSGNKKAARLGRLAYAWAEAIDPETAVLDEMRAEAVKRILLLKDVLEENGIDIARHSSY